MYSATINKPELHKFVGIYEPNVDPGFKAYTWTMECSCGWYDPGMGGGKNHHSSKEAAMTRWKTVHLDHVYKIN